MWQTDGWIQRAQCSGEGFVTALSIDSVTGRLVSMEMPADSPFLGPFVSMKGKTGKDISLTDLSRIKQSNGNVVLTMWNINTGKRTWSITSDNQQLGAGVAFSLDGRRVVSAGMSVFRPDVTVRDAVSGVVIMPLISRPESGWSFGCAFGARFDRSGGVLVTGEFSNDLAASNSKLTSGPIIWRLR